MIKTFILNAVPSPRGERKGAVEAQVRDTKFRLGIEEASPR